MATLIIAEKPSMGKDIARVIGAKTSHNGYMEGNGYVVTWAIGHLVELAHQKATKKWTEDPLPLMDDFYLQPSEGKLEQINIIKALLDGADKIICACDAGREGELIFRYIYSYLQCEKPFVRLWIQSLTDSAIKAGFDNLQPGRKYDTLYFAAKARSEADWLVGINATRALTLAVKNGDVLTLGRVQTPTLAAICKRFLDNKNFISTPFWNLYLKTAKNNIEFKAKYPKSFNNKTDAEIIQQRLSKEPNFAVKSVETKEKKEMQPLLYDLTGLQKAASKKHGITPDGTLKICQSLYEKKYLSYPRTGSCYITDDVFATIPALISTCKQLPLGFNVEYYNSHTVTISEHCVDNKKVTDHHGLLPTEVIPDIETLTKPERTIYTMVVTRMYEAFHTACLKDVTSIILSAAEYDFVVTGSTIKQAGWREVSQNTSPEDVDESIEAKLPVVVAGENLPNAGIEINEGKTKPLPLFTDATLLGFMETAGKECEDEQEKEAMKDCGIGTPATRDAIILNLITKTYVVRDKKNIIPTEKGLATYDIIKEKAISNVSLTGNWEKRLADIETGNLCYQDFMTSIRTFVMQLTNELSTVDAAIKSSRQLINESMPLCPKCKQRHVRVFEKGIGCVKECGFVIWRTIAKKSLTDTQLINLVEKGKTGTVKGFTSKEGKLFDAGLKTNPDFTVSFDFQNNKPIKK